MNKSVFASAIIKFKTICTSNNKLSLFFLFLLLYFEFSILNIQPTFLSYLKHLLRYDLSGLHEKITNSIFHPFAPELDCGYLDLSDVKVGSDGFDLFIYAHDEACVIVNCSRVHDEERGTGICIGGRDVVVKPITDLLKGFIEEGRYKGFGRSRCSGGDSVDIFAGDECDLIADRAVFDTEKNLLLILDIVFNALQKIVESLRKKNISFNFVHLPSKCKKKTYSCRNVCYTEHWCMTAFQHGMQKQDILIGR